MERYIRGKCVVLCAALWDDHDIEERSVGKGAKFGVGNVGERGTEESQSPRNLRIPDSGLAGCSQHRLGQSSAVVVGGIVCDLSRRRIVQQSSVPVPEGDARGELRLGTDSGQVVRAEQILVAVQEAQRTREGGVGVRLGEVGQFGRKVRIVYSVIEPAGGETLGVPLERMDLFDLAAVGQSDVRYTKVVFGIVVVRRYLAYGNNQT